MNLYKGVGKKKTVILPSHRLFSYILYNLVIGIKTGAYSPWFKNINLVSGQHFSQEVLHTLP
ncbi:hypothetical protein BMETH_463_1 [methanotrophic bacterial endosymbiont of Bathymodiolus sp.]|jgi:D-ribose pyranose/furanose isomerase RbsD|nr:hypothetical protein BMETH_463_1 [methanotrophic bacterial endosymbiont of Bathymodiolus sp.]